MHQRLIDLVAAWEAKQKTVSDFSNEELLDLLFEPVTALTAYCSPSAYLHLNKDQFEWDRNKFFFNFRYDILQELKRREQDANNN